MSTSQTNDRRSSIVVEHKLEPDRRAMLTRIIDCRAPKPISMRSDPGLDLKRWWTVFVPGK
jgi:hypothetical protein